MKQVALLRFHTNHHDCYECGGSTQIADSITKWSEVTDEEFEALKNHQYKFNYVLVERPSDEKELIAKSVQAQLNMIEAEKNKQKKLAAQREQQKKEREAGREERERKKFLRLQEKFGKSA